MELAPAAVGKCDLYFIQKVYMYPTTLSMRHEHEAGSLWTQTEIKKKITSKENFISHVLKYSFADYLMQ